MAPRVVLSITPGNDKLLEAKVREAIQLIDGPIEWGNEALVRVVEDELRKTYPDVEVTVVDHPIIAPTWTVYRDGAPRRLRLD
jgi:hypothetical protein